MPGVDVLALRSAPRAALDREDEVHDSLEPQTDHRMAAAVGREVGDEDRIAPRKMLAMRAQMRRERRAPDLLLALDEEAQVDRGRNAGVTEGTQDGKESD